MRVMCKCRQKYNYKLFRSNSWQRGEWSGSLTAANGKKNFAITKDFTADSDDVLLGFHESMSWFSNLVGPSSFNDLLDGCHPVKSAQSWVKKSPSTKEVLSGTEGALLFLTRLFRISEVVPRRTRRKRRTEQIRSLHLLFPFATFASFAGHLFRSSFRLRDGRKIRRIIQLRAKRRAS